MGRNKGRDSALAIALSAAVPLWIMKFKEAGGPTDEQLSEIMSKTPLLLGEHGDALFFRAKGKTAKVFNRTAEAIAALSFCPGGITIFGLHFKEEIEHNRG